MKFSLIFSLLPVLFLFMSCTQTNSPDTDETRDKRWKKLQEKALAWNKSNSDSMLHYARQLYKEVVEANNLKWKARGLMMLGSSYSGKGNPDTALLLFRQAMNLADSIRDSALIERAHNYLGFQYFETGLFQLAEKEYLTGLAYAEKLHDSDKIIHYYNNLGSVAENTDNLNKAQLYINKAITLAEKSGDTLIRATSMRNLAYVMTKSGDSARAISFLRSALTLLYSIHHERWQATIYSDLGIHYRYIFPDSSYYYYNKALDYHTSHKNEGNEMITRFNMANLLFDKGKYRDAEKIFSGIYQKSVRQNNLIGQAYSSIMMAAVYEHLNDFPNATRYITIAEALASRWNQPDFTQTVFQHKIEISKAEGKYKEAVASFEQLVKLTDSLNAAENKNKILELQNQFEMEKKEFEITQLKQQTAIQQDKLQDRNILIFGLVAIISLITLSLFVILYYYRKSTSANQKLTGQTEKLKNEIQIREKIEQNLSESEKQLMKSNAAKDKFFSIIAHDLKNPFNTIFGFTDLLYSDLQEYTIEETRQSLEKISEASKQAYSLLENLLIWAQTQSKNIEFKPEILDLQHLVNDAIGMTESQAKAKNITLASAVGDQQKVFTDENLFGTILRNLLTNAIKFTNPNGNVQIFARLQNNHVEISVKDNGLGVARDQMDHIFKIENKIRTLGTNREKGSGLGLILSKEFVEMQGGRIWAESEPGKGSRFTFSVPIA